MDKYRRRFLAHLAVGITAPLFAFRSGPESLLENSSSEEDWERIKKRFSIRPDLRLFNAANLCPAPKVVSEKVAELTAKLNSDVSFGFRTIFNQIRRESVSALASFLGVTDAEIGITRNSSEANCIIAHGIDLRPDHEVIIWDQNHPSNREVWLTQSRRLGFKVVQVSIPPDTVDSDQLVKAFMDRVTPNTRLISFSHISNITGLALPAREICNAAAQKNILTLVDGAQSFGMMELNLPSLGCTFFTASTHKWFMGPFENGILYIKKESIPAVWPNIIGAGWKESSTVDQNLCVLGQRNDPTLAGIGQAIAFQLSIGQRNIHDRVLELTHYMRSQIQSRIPAASFITPVQQQLSSGIVVLTIKGKDSNDLFANLHNKFGVAAAPAGGLRFSPHIYNTKSDVDFAVDALVKLAS